MLRIVLLLIGWMYASGLQADESKEFYQVQALPGDGIYALLRRYDLDQFSCNFDKFYELNKLKKNARLQAGRSYFLPIFIYAFNGKTIRSSIGVNDWDLAVRIQKYNESMLERQLREKSFQSDKVLWVPYHELKCPKADLEIPSPIAENPEAENSGSGARNFPIFGPKYAYTPLESDKLRGKVFYVVAGHGGPDPGAMARVGDFNLCEDEYAYDVALRLCRKLVANGATAYMINRDPNDGIRSGKYLDCDEDETLWGDVRMKLAQKPRLFQRSDIINELYEKHRLQGVTSQTAIMIHVDSRSRGERTDIYFYHYPDNEDGQKLAQALHHTMKTKYKKYREGGYYHGTISGRDLHMLRESKPLSVYVELANIRNPSDQQRILLENNRQLLADWLYEGLIK